jgi:hypothetical protein
MRGTHKTWIPLVPRGHFALLRTDLYIHPRGPHGSDGCVVLEKDDFNFLRSLLSSSPGKSIVAQLQVVELPALTTKYFNL